MRVAWPAHILLIFSCLCWSWKATRGFDPKIHRCAEQVQLSEKTVMINYLNSVHIMLFSVTLKMRSNLIFTWNKFSLGWSMSTKNILLCWTLRFIQWAAPNDDSGRNVRIILSKHLFNGFFKGKSNTLYIICHFSIFLPTCRQQSGCYIVTLLTADACCLCHQNISSCDTEYPCLDWHRREKTI